MLSTKILTLPYHQPGKFPTFKMASTGVELTVQSERAFQKQPIYQNSKVARQTTRTKRWYKDVGLGFKTPRAAIDGQYIGELDRGME